MADRPYHHGDLRAALLAGAERTLAERGPAALSLRELARETGVSHAAPGRHFKDKGALLDALALTGFERLADRLEEASASGGSTREQILALARAYTAFAAEHGVLLDLMYTRKYDSEAPERLFEAVSRLLDMLVRPIAEGQSAGEIADGDPAALAFTVSAALHGFTVFKAAAAPEDADAGLAEMVRVLFEGLSPR